MIRRFVLATAWAAACGTGESGEAGVSATKSGLTVGGCQCAASGSCSALSYSDVPPDGKYIITTFGGGSDTKAMSCGGIADAKWAYVADRARFPCGTKLLVEAKGKQCVAQVADCGPNRCVEQAASGSCSTHFPVLDVSPVITKHLFGFSQTGWSDKLLVVAKPIDPSFVVGCPGAPATGGTGGTSGAGGAGGAAGAGAAAGAGGAAGSSFGGAAGTAGIGAAAGAAGASAGGSAGSASAGAAGAAGLPAAGAGGEAACTAPSCDACATCLDQCLCAGSAAEECEAFCNEGSECGGDCRSKCACQGLADAQCNKLCGTPPVAFATPPAGETGGCAASIAGAHRDLTAWLCTALALVGAALARRKLV